MGIIGYQWVKLDFYIIAFSSCNLFYLQISNINVFRSAILYIIYAITVYIILKKSFIVVIVYVLSSILHPWKGQNLGFMALSGDKEMEHLARIGLVFQEETERKFCFWKCFQIIYGHKSEVRTMKNINNRAFCKYCRSRQIARTVTSVYEKICVHEITCTWINQNTFK